MNATMPDDECAEKNCQRPSEYGVTLNHGDDLRIEVYLCEEHFDRLGERQGAFCDYCVGDGRHLADCPSAA